MPLEILSIEEVAEIKGGTVDNPAWSSTYACPASSAETACKSRDTCGSMAYIPEVPPAPRPEDPTPTPTPTN